MKPKHIHIAHRLMLNPERSSVNTKNPLTRIFRPSEAVRRSAFKFSSVFWFFFSPKKERERYALKILLLLKFNHCKPIPSFFFLDEKESKNQDELTLYGFSWVSSSFGGTQPRHLLGNFCISSGETNTFKKK